MTAPSAADVTATIDRLHAATRAHLARATDAETLYQDAINRVIADRARASALADLTALTAARATANAAWRELIAASLAMGASAREVAQIAGITPAYARQLATDTLRAQREDT